MSSTSQEKLSGSRNNAVIEQSPVEPGLTALGRLPAEIRSMIFDLATESIGELRLVCKSWLEMVGEWLTTDNKPAFLNLAISEETAEFMQVAIEFRNYDAPCFLDLWHLCRELRKETAERVFSRFPHYTQVHLDIPYEGPLFDRLSSILSTKTRDLSIGGPYRTPRKQSPPETDRFLDSTAFLLKSLKRATTLSFSRECLNDASAHFLSNITRHCSIDKLSVCIISGTLSDPRSFMMYAASTFETVDITQLNESCFASNLFLGSQIVNWVQLITEMLRSGLKELHLKNVYNPLIDHPEVRHIIDVLMSSNKQFVFSTNIREEFPMNIEFNNIQVKHLQVRCSRDYQMYPVIEITSTPVLTSL